MEPEPQRDERAVLRLHTYLAPGLPLALFEAVARRLARVLGLPACVTSDPTRSAPEPEGPDPFRSGEADVGFLCAPGYLWLAARRPPAVELVPAAFVFDDPRAGGRPVYFADLVVPSSSPARSLGELRGARWVYNDPCSLSGYFSVLAALEELGAGPGFFASARALGSHHLALRAVASGAADLAAIDSNVLLLERRRGGARGVRVLTSLGPYPVQPVVVRTGLAPALERVLAPALLGMHESAPDRAALAACGVRRFAPISPADYEPERALLARAARGSDPARCGTGSRPGAAGERVRC
jgi:ABC-type phosphate/phosphonate transport system substrate-binding protein